MVDIPDFGERWAFYSAHASKISIHLPEDREPIFSIVAQLIPRDTEAPIPATDAILRSRTRLLKLG